MINHYLNKMNLHNNYNINLFLFIIINANYINSKSNICVNMNYYVNINH